MKNPLIILLLCLASTTFWSQDLNTPIPVSNKVKIGTLDNGLTYYLRENAKPENKIELRLVVNAGSILEDERQLGLAHFLEHMAFNGTKSFKKNDIVSFLQSIGVEFGADLNAYTSFDETVYILPVPLQEPENLDKGFQVLKEMGFDMLLDPEEIDNERGVILEELRISLSAERRILEKTLADELYGSKYVERLPIGTKEVIENFTYDDLRRFYKTWYRPDLMAIIAVGDVDVAILEEKVTSFFGTIPAVENPKVRPVFNVPNHDDTKIAMATDKEAQQTVVQVLYKDRTDAKPNVTKMDYRESVINNLFSTMISNRLNELANGEKPPFLYGGAQYGGTYARSKNAYRSRALTTPEKALNSLNTLLTENERVRKFGFLASELSRAKQDMLTRYEKSYNERDKKNSSQLLGEYMRNFLEQEPIPGIEWEYKFVQEILPAISLEEVNGRIERFLHKDNMVVVLRGPENEATASITEKSLAAVVEGIDVQSIEAYTEKAVQENLTENLPKGSSVSSKSFIEDIEVHSLVLSNGVKVYYKQTDFQNDNVLVRAYSPGGTSLFALDSYLASELAMPYLNQAGYGGLTVSDMEKYMSGKTASFQSSIGTYQETGSGSATNKDLETLFELMYVHFTSLNKNKAVFDGLLNNLKAYYPSLLSNPQRFFQIAVADKQNEGNERYTGFPSAADFDAVNYDLAHSLRQSRFADGNDFTFFFVGNFDPKNLEMLVQKYLGALPVLESKEVYQVPKFRVADAYERFEVKKGTDPKSYVNFTWREEMPYDPETDMYIDALGELLSIKLIEKLREEESGVYGVGASGSMQQIPFGNLSFRIAFPCGPENVESLINFTLEQIDEIKSGSVLEEDVNKIKESYLVNYRENLKKNRFWLSYMTNSIKYNKDWSRVFNYEEKVANITIEDLVRTANLLLDENYFLAILNPED